MTAPSRTATATSAVTASQAISFSSGGNVDAVHGAVMLIRRQSSSGSVDLLAGAAVSGWTQVGSGVTVGTTSRVAVLAFYRQGNGSFAGGTFTATNSVQTNVNLLEFASIHGAAFVHASDFGSTPNTASITDLAALTSGEDASTLLGFVALGGTAGGSGIAWGSGWTQVTGASSSSSNSYAHRSVDNTLSQGATPTWTTAGLGAGVLLMLDTGAVNSPPTVDAGPNQNVAASATVTLAATASDPDGTIASHAWTYLYPTSGAPALSSTSVAGPTFTAGAAGSLYILQDVVTDNGGLTATDTVEIRVPTTGTATTLAGAGTGGTAWTIIGGSATEGAALADGTDTTRVESPDMTSTLAVRRWRLKPMSTRTALAITLSGTVLTAASSDASVGRLFCGSTQIAQWSLAATTSDQNVVYNLTSPEIAAITDWGALYVEVGAGTP